MVPSVYFHVPFCRHRCGYCNFTVVQGRRELHAPYLAALQRELESTLAAPQEVATLFIGGGTPTQLGIDGLQQLLEIVRRWFTPAAEHEWSVEANPEDLSRPMIQLLADAGVTRLSLGSQGFSPAKLRVLERTHGAAEIDAAVARAREAGMAVSLDLIFAAPGERLEDWRKELAAVARLAPHHVSTYGLTFEKGTRFWGRLARGELTEAGDELQRAMYLEAVDRLAAGGWEHYEISNYALPGSRCRHNENYWSGGNYHAFGPGASRHCDGVRETNHRSTFTYLRRVLGGTSPVAEREVLSPAERAGEHLAFGLRMLAGVDQEHFARRHGVTVGEHAGPAIAELIGHGLLEESGRFLRLTRSGLLLSDTVSAYVLSSS